ncbi:MAG: hypothetical protein ACREH5_09075 [Candidatus Omnitrophota bacterium]
MKIIAFVDKSKENLIVSMSATELANLKGAVYFGSSEREALVAGQSFDVSDIFKEATETIASFGKVTAALKASRDEAGSLLSKMESLRSPKAKKE